MIDLFFLASLVTGIGVIYILSPIDLLPDVIPVLGWTDDALVGVLILFVWLLYFSVEFVVSYWWFLLLILALVGLFYLKLGKKGK